MAVVFLRVKDADDKSKDKKKLKEKKAPKVKAQDEDEQGWTQVKTPRVSKQQQQQQQTGATFIISFLYLKCLLFFAWKQNRNKNHFKIFHSLNSSISVLLNVTTDHKLSLVREVDEWPVM